MMHTRISKVLIFFFILFAVAGHAQAAAEQPLATLGELAVYPDEVATDMQRLPEANRTEVASNPSTVQQAAANLILRKALAARASQENLDKSPNIQLQMKLLQQRYLSDLWLAEVERKALPAKAEVERLAELKYQSEAFTRFKIPAQVAVSHMLLPNDAAGKAKVDELLVKLKAGSDFTELAKQHSIDPGSASRGGALGVVAPGKMVPSFEQAAFALQKVGELAGPVTSEFGLHIIRLDQRIEGKIAPFSEVKDGLVQEVVAKIVKDARNAALADILKQIKLNPDAVKQFVDSAKPVNPNSVTN